MTFAGDKWNAGPPETSRDILAGTDLIRTWTKEHSLEDLPVFAWGISIGGNFVTTLSLYVKITAQVRMCSYGQLEAVEGAKVGYPSTLFVHTTIDANVTRKISVLREILTKVEVSTAELLSYPKLVYPYFLAERIRCMTEDMSEKVYNALKAEGWIDSAGYVIKTPFREDYTIPLRMHCHFARMQGMFASWIL